jgi:hypothetical protein
VGGAAAPFDVRRSESAHVWALEDGERLVSAPSFARAMQARKAALEAIVHGVQMLDAVLEE